MGSALGVYRSRQLRRAVVFVVPFVVLIVVWHFAVEYGRFPAYLFPGPGAVFAELWRMTLSGELGEHTVTSMIRVGLGGLVACALGLPLGVMMAMNRRVSAYVTPLVTFFQAVPGMAWTPLAILWMGIGYKTVTFIVFLSVFFPVLFNTVVGIRSVSETLIHAALTLGASRWTVVSEVLIPGALANIVTGIRLGFGYGWRALVAAEMIGATSGLGWMIFDARGQLRSDQVIVGMIALGALWLLVDTVLLQPLEARTVQRWGLVR